jgi:hypothetical protein
VDFSITKNPTASVGSEPAILGSRGQHANPYTTEAAIGSHNGDVTSQQRFVAFRLSDRDIKDAGKGTRKIPTTTSRQCVTADRET